MEAYHLERCLALCRQHGVTDAAAFLLERMGQAEEALALLLKARERKARSGGESLFVVVAALLRFPHGLVYLLPGFCTKAWGGDLLILDGLWGDFCRRFLSPAQELAERVDAMRKALRAASRLGATAADALASGASPLSPSAFSARSQLARAARSYLQQGSASPFAAETSGDGDEDASAEAQAAAQAALRAAEARAAASATLEECLALCQRASFSPDDTDCHALWFSLVRSLPSCTSAAAAFLSCSHIWGRQSGDCAVDECPTRR